MDTVEHRQQQHSRLILSLYLAVVWVLVLEPFDFGSPREGRWQVYDDLEVLTVQPIAFVAKLGESLDHFALFFPLGPLLARSWKLTWHQLFSLRALMVVVPLMLLTELAQLFVSRGMLRLLPLRLYPASRIAAIEQPDPFTNFGGICCQRRRCG